jgi:hypothetical protein
MEGIKLQAEDELGFYTRTIDGVSKMTVAALEDFCSVYQPAISQMRSQYSSF